MLSKHLTAMPFETASSRYEAMLPNPAFPVMHYETATASLLLPQFYGHHKSVTPTTPQDLLQQTTADWASHSNNEAALTRQAP